MPTGDGAPTYQAAKEFGWGEEGEELWLTRKSHAHVVTFMLAASLSVLEHRNGSPCSS